MPELHCRTRGNATPKGKPRVYFTCHSEDFPYYFNDICRNILEFADCAIYYSPDMTAPFAPEEMETDLGCHNLFVIPVTYKLLTCPSRAMDADFPYAKQARIPVLPLMMEPGLDPVYPQKFGMLQYLNPRSGDNTEIGYKEKLNKYLQSLLISDELTQRVRAAFGAYIFLSYRKKDRRLANELMRLIHSIPQCRDIAIWYDEYLTPGENFNEGIEKIIAGSKFFILLVTPSLLDEPDGQPNFVMAQEYPAARAAGLTVLPVEMASTDRNRLQAKFLDIPACVDPHDEEAFQERLLETLSKAAITTNDKDPGHNYLMGLAYLEGIDVEVNRDRGMELIISAAEAGQVEAILRLYTMYNEGIGMLPDYPKALVWGEALSAILRTSLGEEHPATLTALSNLAVSYDRAGEYRKALALEEHIYALRREIFGAYHHETLVSLNNLAVTYGLLGDHKKALAMKEEAWQFRSQALGEEHPEALISMNNLVSAYLDIGYYEKALELGKKNWQLHRQVLGEEHPSTLLSMGNVAAAHGYLGQHDKAFALHEKVYALHCKVLGWDHPDTLAAMNSLAVAHSDLGQHEKALALHETAWLLSCKVLGEKHPSTLLSLSNAATEAIYLGQHEKALELTEAVYQLRCEVLGQTHPHTLRSLKNLAYIYHALDDKESSAATQAKPNPLSAN